LAASTDSSEGFFFLLILGHAQVRMSGKKFCRSWDPCRYI